MSDSKDSDVSPDLFSAVDVSARTYLRSSCLVAGPISGLCSRSASDFVKLTGELDAFLRYEVETAAGEAV